MSEFDTITDNAVQDYLIAGNMHRVGGAGTLITGQNVARGAALAKIALAAGTPVVGGSNTGNGVLSAFALAAGGPAKLGDYSVICVEVQADAGVFFIYDPDGILIGQMVVGNTFTGGGITFAIADGSTDFALDDVFTLPVEAGSGKLTILDKAGTDGSNEPYMIASAAVDATSADKKIGGYRTGEFNATALSFASGTVLADVEDKLNAKQIFALAVSTAP